MIFQQVNSLRLEIFTTWATSTINTPSSMILIYVILSYSIFFDEAANLAADKRNKKQM